MATMFDYTFKFTATDKCVKYSYYTQATPGEGNIKRGTINSDFVWLCEACETGFWLYIDE
jgi:hypothetical protein